MYPSWAWIKDPSTRFLAISNAASLATRDALRMKSIVTSPWYQSHWPTTLRIDQNEKNLFVNGTQGFRQSQGISACTTGKRGDCFPEYMEVSTEHGMKKITEVKVNDLVWSMNTKTGGVELKPVTHLVHNGTSEIVEVVLSNGQIIHCTPDHKVWTIEEGMVRADSLVSVKGSELSLDIISIIGTNSKQFSKLFTSHGGVNKPLFTPDKTCVADRVSTLITRDSTPLNVVSSRSIGHISDTYCLCVKDNATLFVGTRQVLVSNCLIIDDPVDSQQAFSDVIRESVNNTWDNALSSRLNDMTKSGVLLIQQRVNELDLTGHLLKKVKSHWTHLSIPMRYEGTSTFNPIKDIGNAEVKDPRIKKSQLLFPSRFPERAVQSLEEDLGEYGTSAQLQQRPVPAGGGIIKKHWWRVLPEDEMPKIINVFISFDTAFSEADSKTSAFSAATRWGIFWHEQRQRYCLLALGMWFARVGYDELRATVQAMNKDHDPDVLLIEKKATGISIIQDLKRSVPGKVRAYCPGKGEDKISRGNSVSPMVQSGQCYVPNKTWALGDGKGKLGLIDYIASFPGGAPPAPDIFDSFSAALIFMRSGNWLGDHDDDKDWTNVITHVSSEEEDEDLEDSAIPTRFYG